MHPLTAVDFQLRGFLDQLFYFEEFTLVFFCGVYRPTAAAVNTKADPQPLLGEDARAAATQLLQTFVPLGLAL